MADHALLARKMWRTLEPYHGFIYFSPIAARAYADLGLRGQDAYFASRAAAFGPVPAPVVIATFFNFRPSLVEHAIPAAWTIAEPSAVGARRMAAAGAQLEEILGAEVIVSGEMEEAAALAREACDALRPEGRPLYAAHASLDWPEEPHLVLWHAITLLRESRGDAHIAALLLAGLDGCESLVTHGAAGDNAVPLSVLQATRGWTDDEWATAKDRLRSRGWLDDEDRLTAIGDDHRNQIERVTDEASTAPYVALGEERSDRLRLLVRPFSKAIAGSGVFLRPPPGA